MDERQPPKKDLSQIAPAGALGVLWTIAPAVAGFTLLAKLQPVTEWLETQGAAAIVIYIGVFVVAAGCGLLPTYAQSLAGGWVFGALLGIPAALAGFVGGAMLGYLIARFVAKRHVEAMIEDHPKALAIRNALVGRGFWGTTGIVALIRVPPNSPFALTNLAMASTLVPFVPFVIGTALGMTPRTALAVVVAAAASADPDVNSVQDLVEHRGPGIVIGGIVVLIIVAMIIGAIGKRALARVTQHAKDVVTDRGESGNNEVE